MIDRNRANDSSPQKNTTNHISIHMLTKDLIQCRCVKGELRPQFIDTSDTALLSLAQQLLDLYAKDATPLTRGELEERAEAIIAVAHNRILAKGLHKVVESRAEFTTPAEIDYPSERKRLFLTAAKLLKSGRYFNEQAYRNAIAEQMGDSPLLRAPCNAAASSAPTPSSLFADLPENDRLTRFQELNARQVLERYNISLVQGLLLHATHLTIDCQDEASRLRRVFKYLRFFRLLVSIERLPATNAIRMIIDGPASVFEQSKRYGLQLASFFPAVCTLNHWTLTADVQWKERDTHLRLDETTRLVCPYHNFAAVVPEEFTLFEKYLREHPHEWTLKSTIPFLKTERNCIIFPDFCFEHTDGTVMNLELFHRWHGTQLAKRIQFCENHPEFPLIIGVDRVLLQQPEIAERLAQSPWFATHGFEFRDYPAASKVIAVLENMKQPHS